MPDDPISPKGAWITPDGRVVTTRPTEGRLLVAPGTPITPDMRVTLDRAVDRAISLGLTSPGDDDAGTERHAETTALDPEGDNERAPRAPERATAPAAKETTANRPYRRR